MKRLVVEPSGWPCKLRECPPGHFVYEESLCFKTEYGSMESLGPKGAPGKDVKWQVGNHSDVYNEGGESFWGGVKTKEERDELEVQPVMVSWEEYDA